MKQNKYFSEKEFQIAKQCNKALYLYNTQTKIQEAEDSNGYATAGQLEQQKFKWRNEVKNQFDKIFSQEGVHVIKNLQEYPLIDPILTYQKTKKFIEKKQQVIKDAVFLNSNFISKIDLLTQKHNKLDVHMFSMKTGSKTGYVPEKDVKLVEFAYRCFIMEKSGFQFEKCFIYYLDRDYVRNGPVNANLLFTSIDVTKEIRDKYSLIHSILKTSHKVLCLDEEPFVHIGSHCSNAGVDCSFYNYCSKHIPKNSFFLIPRLRSADKWKLYKDGNIHMEDVVYEWQNTKNTRNRQTNSILAVAKNKEIVDIDKIKEFCANILENDNIYLIDVDSAATPVPLEDGLSPYAHNIMSYTIIKENDDKLTFSQKINNNNLREFIKSLTESVNKPGPILGYNISFIRMNLSRLIKYVPEYSEQIKDIVERLVELMMPFKQGWYASPKMEGSMSYVKVLQSEAFYNAPYKKRVNVILLGKIADAIYKKKNNACFTNYLSLAKKDALDRWKVWTGLRDISNNKKYASNIY